MMMPESYTVEETGNMNRREAREKALQTLFQLDNIEIPVEEAMGFIMEDKKNQFYEKLVTGTMNHREEIDAALVKQLEHWSLDRLHKIERTVLRLAVFELLYNEDVPERVVMNEAIELCKTFGDEKSGRFVNGVLSKFSR